MEKRKGRQLGKKSYSETSSLPPKITSQEKQNQPFQSKGSFSKDSVPDKEKSFSFYCLITCTTKMKLVCPKLPINKTN